jgi:hypothetical protein
MGGRMDLCNGCKNKRIECQHPGENSTIAKVLEIPEDDLFGFPYLKGPDPKWNVLIKEQVGVLTNCICLGCGETHTFDVERDILVCKKCKNTNVLPLEESDGKSCPICNKGKIKNRGMRLIT